MIRKKYASFLHVAFDFSCSCCLFCILYYNLLTHFALGSRTVVHPKACIIAEAGPIIIGEGNLIEERCKIINRYVLQFIFYRINTMYCVCFTVLTTCKVASQSAR